MRRIALVLVTLVTLTAYALPLRADWHEFWYSVKVDWHRNNQWPEPFLYADRHAAVEPLARMVSRGWQLQNTISSYHFDPESQELTSAGEHKVHWILTQSPPAHRTVFVFRGEDSRSTAARVESVRQYMTGVWPDSASMPGIVQTDVEPRGWPAEDIDDTYRKALQSRPSPILPAAASLSGGGGSN